MHAELAGKREEVAEVCRRFGVARLEVFGSAARVGDFDTDRSDVDLLVTFAPEAEGALSTFVEFKSALEDVFRRRVDLVERRAIEASRNYIRRRRILAEAAPLYAA